MATQLFNNAIAGASKIIQNTIKNNSAPDVQKTKLTPKQQVDLFLSMPDSTLEAIKVSRGEVEYQRYLKHMTELSKRYYNAS